MQFILFQFFFFSFFFFLSNQKTLYIDCSASDVNSGESENDAIKTIGKLNSMISGPSFEFTKILFKSSCIFKEKLLISNLKGTETVDFEIGKYGNGENPIIDTSTTTNGWTNEGNGIYSTTIEEEIQISSVFINNKRIRMTSFPTNDEGLENYHYTPSESSDTSIVPVPDEFVSAGYTRSDIVGAHIYLRYRRWCIHGTTVKEYDAQAKTIELTDKITAFDAENDGLKAEFGFILLNKYKWLENCQNCFYHDVIGKKLYIKKTSGDPNNSQIDYINMNNDYGLSIQQSSHITIKNLKIEKNREAGIHLHYGLHNITVESNVFDNNGRGIYSRSGIQDFLIKNNKITKSMKLGMHISAKEDTRISNNFIDETMTTNAFIDYIFTGTTVYGTGVWIGCYSCERDITSQIVFEENEIQNSGYNGIHVTGYSGIQVRKNLINYTCTVTDDCGSLYAGGGYHVLTDNLFMNSLGNSFGTSSYPGKTYSGAGQGIYPDEGANSMIMKNNVIENCQFNFQFHNARNNTAENNLAINARYASFYISEHTLRGDPPVNAGGNIVKNNIFFSLNQNVYGIGNSGYLGFVDAFDELDYNYYFKEYFRYYASGSEEESVTYSVEDWNKASKESSLINAVANGWDEHSKGIYPGYEFVEIVYSPVNNSFNLVKNGEFLNDINGFSSWAKNSELTTTWNSNFKAIQTEVQLNQPEQIILFHNSEKFTIKEDQTYVVEFEVWAEKVNGDSITETSCRAVIIETGNGWGNLGFSESIKVSSTPTKYEFSFSGNKLCDVSRFDFSWVFEDYDAVFYMSYLRLYEVEVKTSDLNDSFEYFINPSVYESKTIELNGQMCDHMGNILPSKTISLEPLKGIVLVNCFCNNDGVCNNYENANTCPQDNCVPTCGNKVCEATETIFNCPSDCVTSNLISAFIVTPILVIGVVFFIVVAIVLIVVIALFVNKKGKEDLEMTKF